MSIFLLLLLLWPAQLALAQTDSWDVVSTSAQKNKKVALFVGGGDDSPGEPDTIFDYSAALAGQRLSKNWTTTVLFDGKHQDTEEVIQDSFKQKAHRFTAASFKAEIDKISSEAKSGSLKKGDEVLVAIETHGGVPDKSGGHPVSISGYGKTLNLNSELIKLRDLLEKKNIKLGIVDLSCYSGATLDLATDKTCVVSAADRESLGYAPRFADFWKDALPGQNLESVFLKMRRPQHDRAFDLPSISTEAGRKAQVMDVAFDPAFPSSVAELTVIPKTCEKNQPQFAALLRQLQQLQSTEDLSWGQMFDAAWPVKSLADKLAEKMVQFQKLDAQAHVDLNKFSTFADSRYKKRVTKMSGGSVLTMKYYDEDLLVAADNNFGIGDIKGQMKSLPKDSGTYERLEKELEDARNEREVYRQSKNQPDMVKSRELLSKVFADQYKIENAQNDLKNLEVQAYDELYSEYSKQAKGPNPCRDFVF